MHVTDRCVVPVPERDPSVEAAADGGMQRDRMGLQGCHPDAATRTTAQISPIYYARQVPAEMCNHALLSTGTESCNTTHRIFPDM